MFNIGHKWHKIFKSDKVISEFERKATYIVHLRKDMLSNTYYMPNMYMIDLFVY